MAEVDERRPTLPPWLLAVLPLVGLAALLVVLAGRNPVADLAGGPPVEDLAVERTVLSPGVIELRVRNTGPEEITIAQVMVNDAFRRFAVDEPSLGRLGTTWLAVPYPWEEAVPLHVAFVTSTGVTFEHEIASPVLTPEVGARSLLDYGLLGVYIGLIPVALGLVWFPSLRRASPPVLDFFLAFTVGLLAFLFVDAVGEGLEQASRAPGALGGLQLFALGVIAVLVVMGWVGSRLARRESGLTGLALAYAVAVGIGLHNLGEGLAVGAAVAAGEVALGSSLVLGFTAHNVTEGLAIATPVADARQTPRWAHFAGLAAVAGLPTVVGAWAGGFAFTPAWAAVAFGVAAGAVLQVIWTVGWRLAGGDHRTVNVGAKLTGLLLGAVVMYGTGLLTA